MKIAIPVLFCMLVAVAVSQNTCKTATGGSLGKTSAGVQMCYESMTSSNSTYGQAMKCKASGNTCTFSGAISLASPPADNTMNMTCSNATTPVGPAPMAVSGDKCGANGPFCYGGFTCKSGKCQAANKTLGATCPAGNSTVCDIGQYCSKNAGNTCQAYMAQGAACNTDDGTDLSACGPAGACFSTLSQGGTNGTCIAINSLAAGTLIANATNNHNLNLAGKLCATFYAAAQFNNSANTYCFNAPANQNVTSVMTGAMNVGTPCNIQHFESYLDVNNVTSTVSTMTTLCGYNSNGNSYCGLQQGDQIIMNFDTFKAGQMGALATKCHGLTTIVNCTEYSIPSYTPKGSGASGSWTKSAPWTVWWGRLLSASSNQQLFANVANNVEAVQQSVTAGFWASSATTFGMITACLVAIFAFAF